MDIDLTVQRQSGRGQREEGGCQVEELHKDDAEVKMGRIQLARSGRSGGRGHIVAEGYVQSSLMSTFQCSAAAFSSANVR